MTPDQEKAHFAELDRLWESSWPAGVPRRLRYPLGEIPLFRHIGEWARRDPKRPAVNFYGAVYSYADYDEMTDKVAALLASLGVRKGDRVAVFMQNCPQYHFVFYGILKLGAVYTAISPMSKSFELAHQLKDSGARVIIAQDQVMGLAREARDTGLVDHLIVTSLADTLPAAPEIPVHPSIPREKIECSDAIDLMPALAAIPRDYPDNAVGLEDLAALNYTGGTTGLPKGCMHTHGNMLYTAVSWGRGVGAGRAGGNTPGLRGGVPPPPPPAPRRGRDHAGVLPAVLDRGRECEPSGPDPAWRHDRADGALGP